MACLEHGPNCDQGTGRDGQQGGGPLDCREWHHESGPRCPPEFEALLKKVTPNKATDLMKYKAEIVEVLANEIASRYYYQKGRIEVSFKSDPYIKEAVRVLKNKEEYNKILQGE